MGTVRKLGRPWIHEGVRCDDCHACPILGYRMKCKVCPDHDLCIRCFTKKRNAGGQSACDFLQVQVDSLRRYPPYQIRYFSCNECLATPIQGPRYCHKWRSDYDLCSECFLMTTEPSGSFVEVQETQIHALCKTYIPAFHFHKECLQCGQRPITGPRFDSIKHVLAGLPGDTGHSLCLVCFDTMVNQGTAIVTDYQIVDRPEGDEVIHLEMFCCLQCGEIPICGPAFVNKSVVNESLCLHCYQHMDPLRWQYIHDRVEPPSQYGNPPLAQPGSQQADIAQLLESMKISNNSSFNSNVIPNLNSVSSSATSNSASTNSAAASNSSTNAKKEDEDLDKLNNRLNSAVVQENPNVKWDDVAGLEGAKQALQEAVVFPIKYPQFFEGDRKPFNAFLLYGPPGTGKSFLAKAVATEVSSTFFSISASDLMSKWHGESEQLVAQLFKKARKCAPSIIFIDEIDSIAGSRKEEDQTGVKTEILVQMQGVGNNNDKVMVLAATNLPYSLDQAIRRRFDKRIYIPLPDQSARKELFKIHLKKTPNTLTEADFEDLASRTPGFSGSDVSVCVKDVLWAPLRKIQTAKFFRTENNNWYPCEPDEPGAVKITMKDLDAKNLAKKIKPLPIKRGDFEKTLAKQKPTVNQADLALHQKFTKEFGEEGTAVCEEVESDIVDCGHEWSDKPDGLKLLPDGFTTEKPQIKWSDIAGLEGVKRALHEAVVLYFKHPHFFTGSRRPWTSFLLYGPPGTGKTLLAKAAATEADCSFFGISSDLPSRWRGKSQKIIASLFQKARMSAPSVVFIDEIDFICGQGAIDVNLGMEDYMRAKTEILVQMKELCTRNENVLILAAASLPYAVDPSIMRGFERRIHIPLPDHDARRQIFRLQLGQLGPDDQRSLADQHCDELAWQTAGFSGSDIAVCVKSVSSEPVRKAQAARFFKQVYSSDPAKKGQKVWTPCLQFESGAHSTTLTDLMDKGWGDKIQLAPILREDFDATLAWQTPTVSREVVNLHLRFTHEFGEVV